MTAGLEAKVQVEGCLVQPVSVGGGSKVDGIDEVKEDAEGLMRLLENAGSEIA
jgi:hypothetical protein